eukprot:TRINITY_DN3464_c0_g1_i1.p1 TRINITY_DN3464_c0_g1~~TRINITY_DN3464_c0_g1_i1.p1  ORF type:complete len:556 (-),score=82.27 TRINITY_DN3464_c0_g1_i1:71-1738(-)
MARSYDVCVIGAGLSGLVSAHQLASSGLSVCVVEASGRVGGRTYTVSTQYGAIDLGGQWIGATHENLYRLTKTLGVEVYPQYDSGLKVMLNAATGAIKTYGGSIPNLSWASLIELQLRVVWTINRLRKEVPVDDPHKAPRAREWDAISLQQWMNETLWTNDAHSLLQLACSMLFGCEPKEISFLYFLFYCNAAGGLEQLIETREAAQDSRFHGGAMLLSVRLAEKLERGEYLSMDECNKVDGGSENANSPGGDTGDSNGSGDGNTSSSPRCTILYNNFVVGVALNQDNKEVEEEEEVEQEEEEYPQHRDYDDDHTLAKRWAQHSQNKRSVTITTNLGVSVTCRRVVFALPPAACTAMTFSPPLPSWRYQLCDRVFMGCYTKVVVVYAAPFWRVNGYSGEAVASSCDENLPVQSAYDSTHTYTSANGKEEEAPCLVTFMTGEIANKMTRLSVNVRRERVLNSLEAMFGPQARDVRAWFEKSWQNDPFTRGCPVNLFPTGQFHQYADKLRTPIGPIHFGGTETAVTWPGYMEGAVQSGWRVAQEVIDSEPQTAAGTP